MVKPLDTLEIQLLNGTNQIEGENLVPERNDDDMTFHAARRFTATFSR